MRVVDIALRGSRYPRPVPTQRGDQDPDLVRCDGLAADRPTGCPAMAGSSSDRPRPWRVRRRVDVIGPDELVFCDAFRRTLDTSALRRRVARAQAAAGVRPFGWHDLRHTYGSLMAANGVDLATIQAVMRHSALAATGRYLHARPASDSAASVTRAVALSVAGPSSSTTTDAASCS
jgi:hypothetical protein